MSETLFSESYPQARASFLEAVDAFEQAVGRQSTRHREVVHPDEDLSIDVAQFTPDKPEKLYVIVVGLHGLEGYTGSAISRALLAGPLKALDFSRCGLLIFHGMNPWGFHHFRRVNANNVDLNRNFEIAGEPLYGSDSAGYESLEHILNPRGAYKGGGVEWASFLVQTATALVIRGMGPLRQATLSGQYTRAKGVFFGGAEAQPETRFYMERFKQAIAPYGEVLLTDLHTGYGVRGQASPLFPQADSPEVAAFANQGVKDSSGADQTYTARGELVRYSYHTAKQLNPALTFNGLVLEIGTHGLGVTHQLADLEVVVRENQVRHHGATSAELEVQARARFRELFYPSSPQWRAEVCAVSEAKIKEMLTLRGFFG